MRRRDRRCRPCSDRRGQLGAQGNERQRIGVEDERHRFRDRARDDLRGGIVGAEAGSADERVGTRAQYPRSRAQHELGLAPVHGRVLSGGESDPDFPRARVQRGAAGEERCADHPCGTADDAERAERALVHVAQAAAEDVGERAGENGPVEAMSAHGCDGLTLDAEGVNRHRARAVDPVAHDEPGLERDERGGRIGADRSAVRDARVRVDARRHVEREDRRAGGVRMLDERGVVRGEGPGQPDAEEAVDDQPPMAVGG